MERGAIIGFDLAKRVFQVHGAVSNRKVARSCRAQLLPFLAGQPCSGMPLGSCRRPM